MGRLPTRRLCPETEAVRAHPHQVGWLAHQVPRMDPTQRGRVADFELVSAGRDMRQHQLDAAATWTPVRQQDLLQPRPQELSVYRTKAAHRLVAEPRAEMDGNFCFLLFLSNFSPSL